ncbi:M56 family metallopeptidase [Streptomyces sp. LBL]|uniref:M56 family metallopeptidase n=1 Tax=Streptomyces sp. LBL TaxID=2940562 RepID=UPI0024766623|nr:M56 family metallopeptidase [Streptomyces sp. LBL]
MARHHVCPPLTLAVAAGLVLPGLLARSRWAREVPWLALCAWTALALLLPMAVSLTLVESLLPNTASHALSRVVEDCFLPTRASCDLPTVDRLAHLSPRVWSALTAGAAVPVTLTVAFVRELTGARRRRAEHADRLRLVGTREPALRATVVPHHIPVVYCLPGRGAQVVVSSGALRVLTRHQLTAALEHERAHLAGRHHLFLCAASALRTVLRVLPLSRHAHQEVPLLLEMAADDRALRKSSRDALATALYSLAAGQAPQAAFAAGGSSVVVRMRRILTPRASGHPVLRATLAGFVTAALLMPLVVVCCSLPM